MPVPQSAFTVPLFHCAAGLRDGFIGAMPDAEVVNVSRHLWAQAARQPATPALRIPTGAAAGGAIRYAELSFAELAAEADAWAWRLTRKGVQRGDRVLVLVRPGLPLIASVFALFKLGATPVVIDPGMGRKNFLECVLRTQPRVLLGIASAQLASWIFRDAFRSVGHRLWVSGGLAHRIARGPVPAFPAAATAADDLAAILFTSGSTGAPKGVCYEHGMFEAQVRLVRETYGIVPGEVDLAVLPVFALFDPARGMTTIVPQIDPSKPAAFDPAKLVQAIRQNGGTNSFGSPVIWTKVARHCSERGIVLPGVKRILMAGAPVPPPLFTLMRQVFPGAQLHSPYGATEALPVSSVSAEEVIGHKPEAGCARARCSASAPEARKPKPETLLSAVDQPAGTAAATLRGRGTCVGRPVAEMTARVIAIGDGPIATLAEARELPRGEIGEIVVRGPVVTKVYDLLPEATARAKIYETDMATVAPAEAGEATAPQSGFHLPPSAPEDAVVWHRMGDAGYLDAEGRSGFAAASPSGWRHRMVRFSPLRGTHLQRTSERAAHGVDRLRPARQAGRGIGGRVLAG
jgi:acyl-CoA synthetase (AMP-forming)/AMP-acid ligase II